MNASSLKSRILDLLNFSHQQEEKLLNSLNESERAESGTTERWSAKDYLANIMIWKELQTQKLATAVRGETPPEWRDRQVVDQIEASAFEKYRDVPFQEVQQESERIFKALIAQVESLSDEEFTDPERYEWANGEALYQETLGNGFMHPFIKLVMLAQQRDDREAAVRLQDAQLEAVRRADLPDTLGSVLYNQACFYALNGWPEKALVQLPEALHIRPMLVEWSRHDHDLDSLRADPRFQALYADITLPQRTADLIEPQALRDSFATDAKPLVIDVRGAGEYASGHVQGAVNIPLGTLSKKLAHIPREQPIVTYCNMHHRGASRGEQAAIQLCEMGYQARALDGGYPAWKEQGFPVEERLASGVE